MTWLCDNLISLNTFISNILNTLDTIWIIEILFVLSVFLDDNFNKNIFFGFKMLFFFGVDYIKNSNG